MSPLPRPGPFVVSLVALFAAHAHAATYWVAPCGSDGWAGVAANCSAPFGPKRTIQAAIGAANPGDTINVLPGVYVEQIDFLGKEIALVGLGGPEVTIIDGAGDGPVVRCNSFEGPGTSLSGFTVRNGFSSVESGAGMLVALATLEVHDCIFRDNESDGSGLWGGGVNASLADLTLVDCQFIGNRAFSAGGLAIYAGHTHIEGCSFVDNDGRNRGGGIYAFQTNDCTIVDTLFTGNMVGEWDSAGGGLYIQESVVSIQGSTIDANISARGPAGIAMYDSDVALVGTSISHNEMPMQVASGCGIFQEGGSLSLLGCSMNGNASGGVGGALFATDGTVEATLCGFADNESVWTGLGNGGGGGAMYVKNGSLTAAACTFVGNHGGAWGGGAILANDVTVELEGCTFSGNTTGDGGDGGAIRAENGMLVVDACTLVGNAAADGGAISLLGHDAAGIIDAQIAGNQATGDGGGIHLQGGPLAVQSVDLDDNVAGGSGGGLFAASIAITPDAYDPLDLRAVRFEGNAAGVIGGGLCAGTPTRALGCAFVDNAAHDGGGLAAVAASATATLLSCTLEGNSASAVGGAIIVGAMQSGSAVTLVNSIVSGGTTPFGGAAIYETALGGHLELVNCAVVDNVGGGIRIENGATQSRLANTIVRANGNGANMLGLMPTCRNCNVEGGAPGNGNIDADPLFVNAATGNYRLAAGSPCIDAGHDWSLPADALDLDGDGIVTELLPHDFDGAPRIADDPAAPDVGCGGQAIVDIGPFERAGAPADDVLPGDVNTDGAVDLDDLLGVLSAWGPCPAGCCPADVNGDGVVGLADLLAVLSNWN